MSLNGQRMHSILPDDERHKDGKYPKLPNYISIPKCLAERSVHISQVGPINVWCGGALHHQRGRLWLFIAALGIDAPKHEWPRIERLSRVTLCFCHVETALSTS